MKTIEVIAVVTLILTAGQALAGDGVIEINQARAEAGGVTPTDDPGFPVTISQSGSYRLTSNLGSGNRPGIQVVANHVTVDLNGFAISSDNVGGPSIGIVGSGRNTEIKNGTVRLYLGAAIDLGAEAVVRNVRVESAGSGIEVGDHSLVTSSVVRNTDGDGIKAGAGALIENCSADNNSDDGINVGPHSRITGNVVTDSGQSGIIGSSGCTASGNVVGSNSGNGIALSDGCVITNNSVRANGTTNSDDGIFGGAGCVITNNSSYLNVGDGIQASDGAILIGNTANLNKDLGLRLSTGCGLRDNVIRDNTNGTLQGACFQTGVNICDGSTSCP